MLSFICGKIRLSMGYEIMTGHTEISRGGVRLSIDNAKRSVAALSLVAGSQD